MSLLFSPLKVGALTLPNRIIMAPLTRARAPGRVPNKLMAQYYAQRASAGLILTEATCVSPSGVGYAHTPGIWSEEQIAGWRLITEAVHREGGRIFLQLWHVGRVSHPLFLGGELPVAPSAIRPKGHVSLVRPETEFVTPRALLLEEIPGIVSDFRAGARNAKAAGFDGVEIHAANGYLIDQFLQDRSNHRTDAYGGPIENRARFLLEVTDAVIAEWGADRVGVHLAPRGDAHDMGDSNPEALFRYVAQELGKRKIAFLFAREFPGPDALGAKLKQDFGGVFIANERLTKEVGEEMLSAGKADALAFGLAFIANPDLPERLRRSATLNEVDRATLYSEDDRGYTDYPSLK